MASNIINILKRVMCLCLCICLLTTSYVNAQPYVHKSSHTMDNVLDFFDGADSDGLNIIWAHGVNSKASLEEACTDDTMMLETDIILRGIGTENQTNIPVHAHPPDTDSDITLVEWLDRATEEPDKGMKLDFKYIEALEPSMKIIKDKEDQLHVPLWVNADIVIGPNSPKDPISPREFIDTCNKHFPLTTMSLGFTTFWNASASEDMYTWQMIFDNLQYSYLLQQPVTFPIRAIWCLRSWTKFTWLLGLKDDFSITVWSGVQDVVDVTGLVNLRFYGDLKRIYYDLPDALMAEFKEALENGIVKPTPAKPIWNSELWESLPSGLEGDFVFLSTESVGIMGGHNSDSYAGWVQSKEEHKPRDATLITGNVQFVNKYDSDNSRTTLQIALRTTGVSREEPGLGVVDGVIISLDSEGSISIRDLGSGKEARVSQALPRAECYVFEARDNVQNATCHLEVEIVRCKDAIEAPPNEGQMAQVDLSEVPDVGQYKKFHVGFSKLGYARDVIVEDFHVEVSAAVKIIWSLGLFLFAFVLSFSF